MLPWQWGHVRHNGLHALWLVLCRQTRSCPVLQRNSRRSACPRTLVAIACTLAPQVTQRHLRNIRQMVAAAVATPCVDLVARAEELARSLYGRLSGGQLALMRQSLMRCVPPLLSARGLLASKGDRLRWLDSGWHWACVVQGRAARPLLAVPQSLAPPLEVFRRPPPACVHIASTSVHPLAISSRT
jgi:hypothetical protein